MNFLIIIPQKYKAAYYQDDSAPLLKTES